MTSPGEGVTVFTSPYLSAGAPALGEAKGLRKDGQLKLMVNFSKEINKENKSNVAELTK